LNLGRSAYR